MRLSVVFLLLLSGCVYPALKGEHLCREVVHAVALRTLECTGDRELANARGQKMWDSECVAVDEPDVAALECPRTLYGLPCKQVIESGDDPAWWIGQEATCPSLIAPAAVAPDVSDIEPYDGYSGCNDPSRVTLFSQSTLGATGFLIDDTFGDAVDVDSCLLPSTTRDWVGLFNWDNDPPQTLWVSALGVRGSAVTVLTGEQTCAEAQVLECLPLDDGGAFVPVYTDDTPSVNAQVLLVIHVPDADAEVDLRVGVAAYGMGPPN